MKKRKLGPLEVPAIGFGCMVLPGFYFAGSEEQAIATLHRAADIGMNFLDTADAYGAGKNEELVGRAIKGRRDRYLIASKFGNVITPNAGREIDGRPEYVLSACEASLKRLGIETLDLYFQHRVDPQVPIEDTVAALAELVQAGKVRYIGLSEASVETLERAHRVHPVTALQTEYSLWTRDPEAGALAACRRLGIGFVPYSPLGRGFLTGAITRPEDFAHDDYRRHTPRFQGENFRRNLALVDKVRAFAASKGCTPGQLALAWVLAQGDDLVPIPGTKRRRYLEENVGALDVVLTAAELAEIDAVLPPGAAVGTRYPEAMMQALNR